MALRLVGSLFTVLFVSAALSAQTQDATLTFRLQTQLVVETVVVKEKSGKPVSGLSASDFRVTENGVPQTISFVDYQRMEGPAPTVADSALDRTQEGTGVAKKRAAAYKNRRLLALYFDMSSMSPPDQLRSVGAARKFVTTQMGPADLVSILEYEGSAVKTVQDFTDDRTQLETALGALLVGEGQGFEGDANDAASADTGTAFGQDDAEFNVFNTDRQLSALQTAVTGLASVNARKALVYFASGVRLNGVNNQAQLRAALNAAIRANVAIFTVDARGLVASPPIGDATKGSPGGLGMYTGASALAASTNFQRSQDTLYTLSADTGGKALLDNNDLSMGIGQAQQSFEDYYVIGYYTTNAALDGKFRRVEVSVPSITAVLEYRRGYFAGKEFAKFTAADRERQLEEALMLDDPVTDLPIALEVNYFRLNSADYYVPVVVKIPAGTLVAARRRGASWTVIDFIGEIKDAYGNTIQNLRDEVKIKLSDETAAELARRPIEYDTGFTLLPGTYSLKVLARDGESGRIGTYLTPFIVPNLQKEQQRLPISSVVLSSQSVDIRDALYTAGKDRQQLSNPLVQDGQKLIPSVTRVFSKTRELYVYLQAYEQPAEKTSLVAFVSFYRNQVKVFETTVLEVASGPGERQQAIPVKFRLSLAGLPSGKYDVQVSVVNRGSRKVAFWQSPVVITR